MRCKKKEVRRRHCIQVHDKKNSEIIEISRFLKADLKCSIELRDLKESGKIIPHDWGSMSKSAFTICLGEDRRYYKKVFLA